LNRESARWRDKANISVGKQTDEDDGFRNSLGNYTEELDEGTSSILRRRVQARSRFSLIFALDTLLSLMYAGRHMGDAMLPAATGWRHDRRNIGDFFASSTCESRVSH